MTKSGTPALPPRRGLGDRPDPAEQLPRVDSNGGLAPMPAMPGTSHSRQPSDITLKGSDSLYALRYPDSKDQLRELGRSAMSRSRTASSSRDDLHVEDWTSMWIIFGTILVSESARGLILPSLWPYLRSMGGIESTLGVAIAAFSLGRMVATVPLGFLSDHFSMRGVIAICSIIQAVGHLLYMFVNTVPGLIFARTFVGLGSATMSVCRAHVTRTTTKHQRTYFFAYLSALQFIGFAVLPAVGGLTDYIPEISLFNDWLVFDEMTYPAFFLVVANALIAFVVLVRYRNPPDHMAPPPQPPLQVTQSRYGSIQSVTLPAHESPAAPDWAALVVCLLINVCFRGVVAELETITTPVLMDHFKLSLPQASLYIGLLGFIGLGVYLGFKPISQRFSDRSLVFASLAMICTGGTLLYQPFFRLPLSIYLVGLSFIWSLAYPLGQTAILGLFSKVLAGLPAGGFLGLFSASGSLARIGFAMLASIVWGMVGRRAVFLEIALYSAITGFVGLLYYRRLVPPL